MQVERTCLAVRGARQFVMDERWSVDGGDEAYQPDRATLGIASDPFGHEYSLTWAGHTGRESATCLSRLTALSGRRDRQA